MKGWVNRTTTRYHRDFELSAAGGCPQADTMIAWRVRILTPEKVISTRQLLDSNCTESRIIGVRLLLLFSILASFQMAFDLLYTASSKYR
jgi:hypothetical protein